MKLVSPTSEIAALRNICGKDLTVSGTLLAGLDDSYFYSSFTKEAYELILAKNKKTGEIPRWSTVLESPELSEKVRTKLKNRDVPKYRTRQEAIRALEILNEYRQLRGCYELSDNIVSSLRKDKISPSALINKNAETRNKLQQNRSTENEVLVFGKGNNSTQFVKDMMTAEKLDYLPTGFNTFDDENGGIGFGNLFVLGGSTGGGKSTLAAQLGINWADMGEDVTIVPLEMSKKEMTARLMANAAGLDVRKILFGKLSDDEKKKYWKAYKRFVKGKKKTGGTFRIFKPTSDMSIEEIMASIYPFGSRVAIIDYISLLKGVDGDDAWQKLGAVARYCKIYAEANNMIIVLLCQVSDDGVIRYARSIAEHANYAWKFVATKSTREHEIINIEQLKARNGRMFDFTLRAKMDVMQIRDLEIEEREELDSKVTKGGKPDKKGKHKGKPTKDEEDKKPSKSAPNNEYLKDLSEDEED
jgi:replicative DNA helicase